VQLSEAEWKIMNRVWADSPVTARGVLEAVEQETGWAYTTVKTMLGRLVEKGALKERKRSGASEYEPRISKTKARATALHALLDRAFGGALGPMMSHLVEKEKLSKKDRAALERLLREKRK
jgi:BlaI family penicillinase repressor